jgi:hypothetical protein
LALGLFQLTPSIRGGDFFFEAPMTKEELLAAVRSCAEKVGHVPTFPEFYKMTKIKRYWFKRFFLGQAHAFREAGLEVTGSGNRIQTLKMLEDWARVVRQLQKLPSAIEYKRFGRFSNTTLTGRCGTWKSIPDFFRAYMQKYETTGDWADVLEMVPQPSTPLSGAELVEAAARPKPGRPAVESLVVVNGSRQCRRKIHHDRPLYGAPLPLPGLDYEPTNEAGVIYVFGMLAGKLGIQVQRLQAEFPDCEAMREVETGRWQRVRIEFEFESQNFVRHKHPPEGCDLIVCWIHNWPECPEKLEVIELRKIVREGQATYLGSQECYSDSPLNGRALSSART